MQDGIVDLAVPPDPVPEAQVGPEALQLRHERLRPRPDDVQRPWVTDASEGAQQVSVTLVRVDPPEHEEPSRLRSRLDPLERMEVQRVQEESDVLVGDATRFEQDLKIGP
jgi:hypothetical protein